MAKPKVTPWIATIATIFAIGSYVVSSIRWAVKIEQGIAFNEKFTDYQLGEIRESIREIKKAMWSYQHGKKR